MPPTAIDAMVKQCENQLKPFAECPFASLASNLDKGAASAKGDDDTKEKTGILLLGKQVFGALFRGPFSFRKAEAAAWSKAVEKVVTQEVQPAYERLMIFLRDDYRPHARKTAGMCGWKGGRELYDAAVK